MSNIVWLASYPKSGNTWFRILIANLSSTDGISADINNLPEDVRIASGRALFDNQTLLDSGLLTHEEIDSLRPGVYGAIARSTADDFGERALSALSDRHFIKIHDAYTSTSQGESLFGAARAAIVITRDPRDVAISFAHHLDFSIDQAIALMCDANGRVSLKSKGQAGQLRQRLLSWSAHVESWLDQVEVPVHLVRYEDMIDDAAECFRKAMEFIGYPITNEAADRSAKLASFSSLQAQEQEKGFAERVSKDSPFFREGRAGGWQTILSKEQTERIEQAHFKVMDRLGYRLTSVREPT